MSVINRSTPLPHAEADRSEPASAPVSAEQKSRGSAETVDSDENEDFTSSAEESGTPPENPSNNSATHVDGISKAMQGLTATDSKETPARAGPSQIQAGPHSQIARRTNEATPSQITQRSAEARRGLGPQLRQSRFPKSPFFNDPFFNDPFFNDPFFNDPFFNDSFFSGFPGRTNGPRPAPPRASSSNSQGTEKRGSDLPACALCGKRLTQDGGVACEDCNKCQKLACATCVNEGKIPCLRGNHNCFFLKAKANAA